MKLFLAALLLSLSAHAAPPTADCNMANDVVCPLDLSKARLTIALHNSGNPGYCGVKIITNQNSAFAKMDDFMVDMDVFMPDDLNLLTLFNRGNSLLVSDTNGAPTGHLPRRFILEMVMMTKTGESFKELVDRTFGSSRHDGEVALFMEPVHCPTK